MVVVVVLAVVDGSMCVYCQDDVCAAVEQSSLVVSSRRLPKRVPVELSRLSATSRKLPSLAIPKTYLQYLYLRM